MKENYLSQKGKKETTTKQLNSLHYVLHNVAKNGEKCLKECNKLSRNSVLEIQLDRYIDKSKLTVMPDLHRQGNRMMMKLDF